MVNIKVRYHSNVLIVVDYVIMLLNSLVKNYRTMMMKKNIKIVIHKNKKGISLNKKILYSKEDSRSLEYNYEHASDEDKVDT